MKASELANFGVIETPFHSLNVLLGTGGIPFKKIVEISGQASVGKSTLALSCIASAQKQKSPCLWVDTEWSYETKYASELGVDNKKLDVVQKEIAEDILDDTEAWARANKNGLIVLDSVGGLASRSEVEKTADGKVIGAQAKLMASFCRKIVPILAINNHSLIILNHEFTDLMTGRLKTSGGAKLEYHKSVWLRLRKLNKRVEKSGQQIGDVIEVEVRKNKLASTKHQKIEMVLIYGEGFDATNDFMEKAKDKLFRKEGQFWFWKEEKLARGDNALRELFNDDSFAAKVKEALNE